MVSTESTSPSGVVGSKTCRSNLRVLFVVCGLLACADSDGPTEPMPPSPTLRLTVESAPEAILQRGDPYVAVVSAEDTLGNTIPPAQLDLVWRSSDEGIALVDQNGQVTTLGGGLVRIEAAAGGDTAEIRLAVNDIVPEIFDDPPFPTHIAMHANQVLGFSAWNTSRKSIYEFESGSWVEREELAARTTGGFSGRFVGLPSGEFVAAADVVTDTDSTATVWSTRSGNWAADFVEASGDAIDRGPFLFQSGGDIAAFHANRFDPLPGSRFGVSFTPLVWLRDATGSWRDLEHPAKHDGEYLSMSGGFVVSDREMYVCGSLEASPGEPPSSPVVSYWDGTDWALIDMAGYALDYGLVCRASVEPGTAHGALMDGYSVFGVFTLRGGAVTVDTDLPGVVTEGVFSDARTLPEGRWLFTRLTRLTGAEGGLLAPTFVWQEVDGSWRRYWLDPNLSITGFPYVDPGTGKIWFIASSPDGTDLATFVLTP